MGALSGANAGMVEGALPAANKGAGGPLSGAHTGTVAPPMAANMETVGLHSAANAGTVAPPSTGDTGATGPLSAGNTKTVEEALRAASPGGGELLPVGNTRTGAAGRTRTGELLPVGNTRTGEPPTGASTKEVEKALAAANTGMVVPGVPGQGRADEEVAKTGEGAVGSTGPNEGIDPGAVQRTRQQLIRALADFQTTVEVCARGRVLMGAGVYALAVTLEIVPPRREPRVVETRRSKASYRPMPPEVKQCILEALRQRGWAPIRLPW
ncbi:hypothetical protein OV079_47425 [Nannocystis pusilla]|uniref:Uncharacterized protein n=1 Tax=Nannocystis pusilla TaxID=889268 RepID=A0A9X3F7U2_9BACT|nr:hypothetical protein [Nannocystis pusilla]MCY1013041.1 hypothetical protein [Nannocystis pusilla]